MGRSGAQPPRARLWEMGLASLVPLSPWIVGAIIAGVLSVAYLGFRWVLGAPCWEPPVGLTGRARIGLVVSLLIGYVALFSSRTATKFLAVFARNELHTSHSTADLLLLLTSLPTMTMLLCGGAAYDFLPSKAAVANLTRSMAMELAPDVRVNCVCPTTVDNDMGWQGFNRADDPQAAYASFAANSKLQRLPTNDDVVAAFAFLASDKASFMTGDALPVDGGKSAGA